MNNFEEAFKLLDGMFGGNKDNLIAVATIGLEPAADGAPRPVVRCVDAYYEDGVFYITTNALSNKMKQIAKNTEVSITSCSEMFTANGTAQNLGWVLDLKNAEIRTKLRTTFAAWYDSANNEKDENCCILAIRLTKGTLNINHWEKLYFMDFEHKTSMENGGIF